MRPACQNHRSSPGFTLLEMAFVIGLFGILALFLVTRESELLQTRFDTARQERVISDANTIIEAALAFYRLSSPNERWPHTAMTPTDISIEGLMDMDALLDESGNMIDSLLTDIPMNEYRANLKSVPALPGVTMLEDLDYRLSGWATLPVPAVEMGTGMAAAAQPDPTQARWLSLSFWVVSDGPGEAQFIAASLPRGEVFEEHQIQEAGGERFYSRVQAAILSPLDQAYLRVEWPERADDLTFKDGIAIFGYMQADDSNKVDIRFGEDAAGDYFKLVRLGSQTGVEINFDDLKVPGDLTVGGAVMADVDFTDGVDIQGGTLTRADICRKERRLRETLTMVEDYLRRVDPIRYDRDPILTQDFCL